MSTGADGSAGRTDGGRDAPPVSVDRETRVIPVVAEQLVVERRAIDNSVVVRSTVVEEPVERRERLCSETLDIDRVPQERWLDEPPSIRTEGEITIIPVVEEVLVRRWRLVEEVRVTRHRREEEVTVREVLRSNRVEVIGRAG